MLCFVSARAGQGGGERKEKGEDGLDKVSSYSIRRNWPGELKTAK